MFVIICNSVNVPPLEDEIYPRLRNTNLVHSKSFCILWPLRHYVTTTLKLLGGECHVDVITSSQTVLSVQFNILRTFSNFSEQTLLYILSHHIHHMHHKMLFLQFMCFLQFILWSVHSVTLAFDLW